MNDPGVIFQNSIAAHQAGDFAAAANGYSAVLSKQPDNADAWHLAGVLAYQNGRSGDAIQQIQIAIELNPENSEYFANLSVVMNGVGQPGQALEIADEGLARNCTCHSSFFQKGIALKKLAKLDESIQAFVSAGENGANDYSVSMELAIVLQMLGRFPEAIEILEKAQCKFPKRAQPYVELSRFVSSGRYSFEPALMEQLKLATRNDGQISLVERARLNGALGNIYQHDNEFGNAFSCFADANQLLCEHNLKTKRTSFDPASTQQFSESVKTFFSADRIERIRRESSCSDPPIFIVGMPRSGTTLVHQLLSSHSRIVGLGEQTLIGDLFVERILRGNLLDWSTWEEPDASEVAEMAAVYERRIEQALSSSDSARTSIDKMPGNYKYIGFIKCLFPNAKLVHCKRDPRDTCLSCFCNLFEDPSLQAETSSLENLSFMYRDYDRLMKNWEVLFENDIYCLNYETLVSETEIEMRRVLEFLDLPFESNCLETTKSEGVAVQTASVIQARSPIYQSSVGRWKKFETNMVQISRELAAEIEDYDSPS